ncbi:MAG: diguanylate cyclase [Cyanobacteria bacterium J06635_10]
MIAHSLELCQSDESAIKVGKVRLLILTWKTFILEYWIQITNFSMPVEEALKLIQNILYTNTGKQLTFVEREILQAAWENQTYATVAKNSYLSVGYIKDVAYKLWKQLSEILGEKVTKANLRLVLEKKTLSLVIPNPPNISETYTTGDFDLKNYISQLQQEIQQLKQTKEILSQSRAFLESVLNTSLDGITAMQAVRDSTVGNITDFRFLMANPAIAKRMLCRLIANLFYSNEEDLIGENLLQTQFIKDNPTLFNSLIEVIEIRKPLNRELYYEINNKPNWYQIIAVTLGDGISLTIRDITQTKLLELELTRQARIDSLTNIANRRRFDEYLAQEWQRYKREKLPISLILCEIKNFESYKNAYGNLHSDECLIKIAQIINNCAKRAIDLVARYREHQFTVILPNTDKQGAFHVAELIKSEIEKLKIPHVSLSLGIANMIPSHDVEAQALIVAAEKY